MRIRSRTRQRRGAAPELPVRRTRQRVPAAGLRDAPRLVARPARGGRRARHPGRAAAPGGRVMLRGPEDPGPRETLTPSPLPTSPSRLPRPPVRDSVVVRRPARMLLPPAILFHGLVHLVRRRLEPPLHRRLRFGDADGEHPLVLADSDATRTRI